MARPQITGLEYTRLDVDFINDRKIKRLKRLTDAYAPLVYIQVVCAILKEGYYIKWDDDFAFDIADSLDLDEDYVSRVIDACFTVGLLSYEMLKENHIVTSRGIQKQYNCSKAKSKSTCRVGMYSLLVNSEETKVSSEETPVNSEETPVNSESMQQSKLRDININYSSSYSPSPKDEEEKKKEEQEQIVFDFTFNKNWASPNAEYEKLVAFNNRAAAKKKWNDMSVEEKQSVVTIWRQKPEGKPRFSEEFLHMWRAVYDKLVELGAPRRVRLAALADGVNWTRDADFILHVPVVLQEYIERNADSLREYIWPFMQSVGYSKLMYKSIPETEIKTLKQ